MSSIAVFHDSKMDRFHVAIVPTAKAETLCGLSWMEGTMKSIADHPDLIGDFCVVCSYDLTDVKAERQ